MAGDIAPILQMFMPFIEPYINRALGGNLAGTFGSMVSPTNYSNQMFNAIDSRRFDSTLGDYRRMVDSNQKAFLTGFYKSAGVTTASPGSPLSIAASAAWRVAYQPTAMQRGFTQAAISAGILTASPFMGAMDINTLSNSEMRLAFGGAADRTIADRAAGLSGRLGGVFSNVARDFANNPGGYGGLKGGEIGTMVAEMARVRGSKFAEGNIGAISANIKDMARAMGTMKELFQGDLPMLMDKLNGAFGVSSVGSLSGRAMQSRLLQMKHTARLTGVSMDAQFEMASVSRQYSQQVGGTGWGGMAAAQLASSMMGAGGSMAYINEEEFRNRTLRNTTGAQQSQLARYAAGAFVGWRIGKKGTDEELQAQFQLMMKGRRLSLSSLAAATGMSANDINSLSWGFEAKKVLSEGQMSMGMAQDETARKIAHFQQVNIGAALRKRKISLDAATLSGSYDEIRSALAARGVGERDMELAMADVSRVKGQAARLYDQGSAQELDAFMYKNANQRKVAAAARNRANLETALEDQLGKNFGLSGLLGAIGKDKEGKTTIGRLFRGATGMATKDVAAEALMKGLAAEKSKLKGRADTAYFEGMESWIMDSVMGKSQLGGKDAAAFREALSSGNVDKMQELYGSSSVEGKRRALVGKGYLAEGKNQTEMVKEALLKSLNKGQAISEAEYLKSIKGNNELENTYAEKKSEYGLGDGSISMNDIMSKLSGAIDTLIQLLKGRVPA
jgi:hypothetical protein